MQSNLSTILHPRTPDLTGLTFHYLTVEAFAGYKDGRAWWLCQCQCGTLRTYIGYDLVAKKTRSCGCFHKEMLRKRLTTHGQTESAEYRAWCAMHDRCKNMRGDTFKNYAQRGITVCARWESFECFFEDMGLKPTPQHTLERRDNDQGYTPENCLWATRLTQNRNTRKNLFLTHEGRTQCLSAWAKEKGLAVTTLWLRLDRGWTIEDALTIPASRHHKYAGIKKRSRS